MPREKLCGEFITPECIPSLQRLGVEDRIIAAGAHQIRRLSIVTSTGRSVNADLSDFSECSQPALSLSRGRFDQVLFEQAASRGAECIEGIAVKRIIQNGGGDGGARTQLEALSLSTGKSVTFAAPVVVDASGRNSRLSVGPEERRGGLRGSRLYAMKAHFTGVEGIDEQVELCLFPGGYGGLSRVENGLVNACFLVREDILRDAHSNPWEIVRRTLLRNPTARDRMSRASLSGDWLTVGPLTFGARRTGHGSVIPIGDAAGMIDPFTGTGIQMALRMGELVSQAILESADVAHTRARYWDLARPEFAARLKMTGWLRQLALSSGAAEFAARAMSRMPKLTGWVLRGTRRSGPARNV
jgi:flavin-dependent dehydrogenase